MFVGIDIGGTFCDCVAVKDGVLKHPIKVPTNKADLLDTLTRALEQLLASVNPQEIKRITLSTTLITNQVLENKLQATALLAISGPGLRLESLLPANVRLFNLAGSVDHQGLVVQQLDFAALAAIVRQLHKENYRQVAVVAKFGNRNARLEQAVKEVLLKENFTVVLGSELSGRLNFPRRCQGAYLTAATSATFADFLEQVTRVMRRLKLDAPLYIMKADGGALPLAQIKGLPLETIFSGPAASALGAATLSAPNKVGIVADVGGTTTDLALFLDGKPLISKQGARIGAFNTQTRCFAVSSIALGGDSAVTVADGQVLIGPERQGPAACCGGPVATSTDIFNYLGLVEVGDQQRSRQAVEALATASRLAPSELCARALTSFKQTFRTAVEAMLERWEQEPVYHVWRLLAENRRPDTIFAVGGAAGLIQALEPQLEDFKVVTPPFAAIANALGAAITQPVVKLSLRIDTVQGIVQVEETGTQTKLNSKAIEAVALDIAKAYATALAIQAEPYIAEHEQFNQIREGRRLGEVHYLTVQTPWELVALPGGAVHG